MNFVVLPSERVMSIDNASVELDTASWLGGDIEIFAWQGDAGSGFIEYNDRPRVVLRIEDLAPYQAIYQILINAWLEAASREPQPLLLEQARQVKADFVDVLYNSKIRLPYTHWDGWQYDTRDEAVGFMAATAAAFGLPRRMNEAFTRFIGNIGTHYTINYNVHMNALSAGRINPWSETMHNNWRDIGMHHPGQVTRTATSGSGGTPAHFHQGQIIYYTIGVAGYQNPVLIPPPFESMDSFYPHLYSVASGGTEVVRWQPLNWPAQIDINADEFKNALQQIVARRTSLNWGRVARNNHIQTRPSVPDVIAYDVVSGW